MAANATFALKPGVWFLRVRFVIFAPDSRREPSPPSGRKSTQPTVQILEASSVLLALAGRLPIERRPRDRRQFALADNREPWMIGVDHGPPPIKAQRSKAFAKKSRSTTSWPILACSFVISASRPA